VDFAGVRGGKRRQKKFPISVVKGTFTGGGEGHQKIKGEERGKSQKGISFREGLLRPSKNWQKEGGSLIVEVRLLLDPHTSGRRGR